MTTTIDGVKTIQIKNAKNGNFDLNLGGSGNSNEPDVTIINDVKTIQIRNAKNGDFDLNLSGGEDQLTDWIELNKYTNFSTYLYDKYKNEDVTQVGYNTASGMLGRVVYLPNAVSAFGNAINGGEIFLIPKLQNVGSTALNDGSFSVGGAPNRRIFDFGLVDFNTCGSIVMSNCLNIEKLILRSFTEPKSSTQFNNSSLATNRKGAYVYVPQSLLSQFQNSTKWQNWAKVLEFRTIEGSEFEDLDAYYESL